MCKFLKRLFFFLAVVSAIAAGIYFLTNFYKPSSSKEQDLPQDMKKKYYKPESVKRHYTQLNR